MTWAQVTTLVSALIILVGPLYAILLRQRKNGKNGTDAIGKLQERFEKRFDDLSVKLDKKFTSIDDRWAQQREDSAVNTNRIYSIEAEMKNKRSQYHDLAQEVQRLIGRAHGVDGSND